MAIRVLSQEESENYTPLHVTNEQGVSNLERFVVKNLAANPEKAKDYLKSIGYEVRPYGSGFNFAVRKPGSPEWKVVDPSGMDSQDIFDLVGDLASGFLVGGATLSGLGWGSLATGAAAGAGVEALREGLGSLAGVPNNFSGSDIALQGAAGAAGPALGIAGRTLEKASSPAVSATGRFLRTLGAKAAGIKDTPNLSGEAALGLRAAAGRASSKVESMGAAARSYRKAVEKIAVEQFPETGKVGQMLTDAGAQGKTVDLSHVMERLLDHTGAGVTDEARAKIARESSIPGAMDSLIDRLKGRFLGPRRWDALTPAEAAEVKGILQNEAARKGAFTQGEKTLTSSAEYRSIVGRASREARTALTQAMGGPNSDFASTMRIVERKAKSLKNLKASITAKTGSASDAKAEQFLKGVFGSSPEASINALRNAEHLFGVNLLDRPKTAAAAARFGSHGKVNLVPRFTATGNIFGTSLLGGAVMTGHPLAAAAGAALVSPRTVVGATRLGQKYVGPALEGAGRLAGKILNAKSMRLAATAALQQAARSASGGSKTIASESQAKRKAYFNGG